MHDSDKTLALILLCIVLLSLFPLAGYLAIVVLLTQYIRSNKLGRLLAVIKHDPALIFFMAAFGLSALFTKQHMASLAGLTLFGLQLSLFTVIRSHLKDSRDNNHTIIRYIVICGLAVAAYGIFQFYFIPYRDPHWVDSTVYNTIQNRAFATLYNPNVLGSYLIIIISLAASGFPLTGRKYDKVLRLTVLLAAIFCMALTFSRGAWLGLAVSILVIFVFSKYKGYILGSALLTGTALFLLDSQAILSRLNLDFIANDSSNNYRWYLWQFAVKTFAAHPLWGGGIGSFGFFVPSHFKAPGYLVSHAHNIYLQLLAETGLLGFLSFTGYLLWAVYICFMLLRRSQYHETRSLALGIMASCLGLMAHGMVDATLWLPQLAVFMWILIAVVRNSGDRELPPRTVFGRFARFGPTAGRTPASK